MKAAKILVPLLVMAALNVGFPARAPGAELKQLRMTLPVNAMTFYSVYVAQDKGFFRDEGYDFELVVTGGDGPDVDALMAGSVQFTATPPTRLLIAYEQGKRLLGVANLMNRVGINCFMNKTVADRLGVAEKTPLPDKLRALKGLTIGGTRAGAFTYLLATHYVKRAGYVPQTDVKIIGAGGEGPMLAAVEGNKVDIGCIGSPAPEWSVSRGRSIMWVNNTKGEDPEFAEFLFETLYVMPDYAAKNPEIVRGVVKALVRATRFIGEGPEAEHMPILRNRFKGVPDEVLREALANTRAATDPTGRMTQKGLEANVKFLKEAGALKTDIPWTAVVTNEHLPR